VPRYHFIVRDGTSLDDPDGTELPDVETARTEAVRLVGGLLLDAPANFWSIREWHVEVRDHRGLALFRLDVTSSDAPAELRERPTRASP
jgi:hypothetical protein